jgi:hypothetical protein
MKETAPGASLPVARDLVGESFLNGIPLARRIAAATVEAFEQR